MLYKTYSTRFYSTLILFIQDSRLLYYTLLYATLKVTSNVVWKLKRFPVQILKFLQVLNVIEVLFVAWYEEHNLIESNLSAIYYYLQI